MSHYKISDVSVNKIGYVICITDEMLAGTPNMEDLLARVQRSHDRKRAKARIMRRYCPVCRDLKEDCRCE